MDQEDRLTYTAQAFQIDLDPIIQVRVVSKEAWREGTHTQFGVTAPILFNDRWTVAISPWHLIQPMEGDDDNRLQRWITYWISHTFLHLVVLEFAAILGSNPLTFAEVEAKVEEEFEAQHPELYSFGGQIRMLNPS